MATSAGRVPASTSLGTRLPSSPRSVRRSERVWPEGGRQQTPLAFNDTPGNFGMPLNSNRANMDYVYGLSRSRPANMTMSPLDGKSIIHDVDLAWRGTTHGKVRGGSPPAQWVRSVPAGILSSRPLGFVPKTNRPASPRRAPARPISPRSTRTSTMSPRLKEYDLNDSVMGDTILASGWTEGDSTLISWGVDEVVQWLSEVVGLPQYARNVRSRSIDGYALLRISADLSGRDELHTLLGISDRVHCGKFLSGIRKLEISNARMRELQAGKQVGTVNGGEHRRSWKPTLGT